MKINSRKCIIYFLIGVGFGGLIYVISLWSFGANQQTVEQMTVVVLLSGLIGLISMIFESESLPFIAQLAIHLVLVYSLILLMNWLAGNTSLPCSFESAANNTLSSIKPPVAQSPAN